MSVLQAFILAFMHGRTDVTGYDIKVNCHGVWSHQQIYRDLNKLKKANLVRDKVIPQDGKPDRVACTPNSGAKTTLVDWFLQQVQEIRQGKKPATNLLVVVDLMYMREVVDLQDYENFLNVYSSHYAKVMTDTASLSNMAEYYTNRMAMAECNLVEEYRKTLV